MGADVLPVYVVCDVSLSMVAHVGDLNAGLRAFCGAVRRGVFAPRQVHCGVMAFGQRPSLVRPLSLCTRPAEVVAPMPGAGTNFGPAFVFLRAMITNDLRTMRSGGALVRRPLVFFVSDGQPTDPVTWPDSFSSLTDSGWPERPSLVAIGVGDADRDTLCRIGTTRTVLVASEEQLGFALLAATHAVWPAASGPVHDLSTSGPLLSPTLTGDAAAAENGRGVRHE